MTKQLPKHPFRFSVQSFIAQSASEWRERARKVEGLGYSTLQLADHFMGPGEALTETRHPPQNVSAIPGIVMAAEATTTLRVGCRVFCIDYYDWEIFEPLREDVTCAIEGGITNYARKEDEGAPIVDSFTYEIDVKDEAGERVAHVAFRWHFWRLGS